jgi:alpha,alpha-trehalase
MSLGGVTAELLDHIHNAWSDLVHTSGTDDHPRLFLPRPYTVPSAAGTNNGLHYWHAYFMNKGLLLDGEAELALANLENLFYLVGRFGFVPKSSTVNYLTLSQPPCLALMVRDYYRHSRDKGWLESTLAPLEREYHFWMTRRVAAIGLNRYHHHASGHELTQFMTTGAAERLGMRRSGYDVHAVAAHCMAETESGHDFTPRFQGRCADHVPVDLNSYLYASERTLAFICRELDRPEDGGWDSTAEHRLTLMRRYLWDETHGVFTDYDVENDIHSSVISAVSYWPLVFGIATGTEARATIRTLRNLMLKHGVATCMESAISGRQWGYPNVWAPVQYMAAAALRQFDAEAARRVASTFVDTIATEYATSGKIWDKYDGLTGGPASLECPASEIMGWTAGVFRTLVEEYGLRDYGDG